MGPCSIGTIAMPHVAGMIMILNFILRPDGARTHRLGCHGGMQWCPQSPARSLMCVGVARPTEYDLCKLHALRPRIVCVDVMAAAASIHLRGSDSSMHERTGLPTNSQPMSALNRFRPDGQETRAVPRCDGPSLMETPGITHYTGTQPVGTSLQA